MCCNEGKINVKKECQVATQPLKSMCLAEKILYLLSKESVEVITVSGRIVSGLMTCRPPPTAKMAACGALIMAVNSAMPNMPRLEMVKVPP